MKKLLLFLALFAGFLLSALDYAQRENWAVFDDGADGDFDIFYVYPTLVRTPEKALMDIYDPAAADKSSRFSRAQTNFFKNARVFAPFVRQLEYDRVIALLNASPDAEWEKTLLATGINDTRDAFIYYLKHCNGGRPFIFFGHSQGAIDLYCLLKNLPELSPENGFVAAYLPGLPRITYEKFEKDFSGRAVHTASHSGDVGAVIVWNTQNSEAGKSLFSGEGILCINPLNWRTDETPATADENPGAVFYDYRTGETVIKPHFCGARIDLKKGTVIVDLPSISEYDARGMLGAGVFHVNDVCFFAESIARNAAERVKAYSSNCSR